MGSSVSCDAENAMVVYCFWSVLEVEGSLDLRTRCPAVPHGVCCTLGTSV